MEYLKEKTTKRKGGFTSETAKLYGFNKETAKIYGFKRGYTPWNKGLKTGLAPTKGAKHSKEEIEKMIKNNSHYWKGKKFNEKHKQNLSKNHADFNDEKSPRWKGDGVRNAALHQWVAKHKGFPMECSICGTKDRKVYDWANIDHKYRRVLDDYFRACRSCHRNYDIQNNGYKTK